MSKFKIVKAIAIPMMRTLASLLAEADDNVTGKDDAAAKAINVALDALEAYTAEKA